MPHVTPSGTGDVMLQGKREVCRIGERAIHGLLAHHLGAGGEARLKGGVLWKLGGSPGCGLGLAWRGWRTGDGAAANAAA